MANRLFQQARQFVELAKVAPPSYKADMEERAKNALSSAYANSTFAEKEQLHEMQDQLNQMK
ncbi:MAG TPA: DUF3813 domain-containing protein [Chondromyces sp.]|nr:DUF3813 domain-containing protein [Chondromyces sp.]